MKAKDLTGQRFGRLIALRPNGERSRRLMVWACKCDCGKETTARSSNLINGLKRSCGCLAAEASRRVGRKNALPEGEASLNSLYYHYRYNAEKRNLEFSLSRDEAKRLFQSDCYYCGRKPEQVYRNRTAPTPFIYNGIDRMENSRGYVAGNVVPCCKVCNRIKKAVDHNDLLGWVSFVYHRLKPLAAQYGAAEAMRRYGQGSKLWDESYGQQERTVQPGVVRAQ